MRCYRFDRLASIDDLTLHEVPDPSPQRGEVLVRVRAVSLNYRDISMMHGDYPAAFEPGHIPTSDGAGEVVAIGEGVDGFREGDKVIGIFHPRWFGGDPPASLSDDSYGSKNDGWLTELKVVSQEAIVHAPAGLSFEEAATLPCTAPTAWNALTGASPIRAGDTVLTQGTGGVSIFAVQLAKAVGARVIATTSSAEKGERLRALGADEVIDYRAEAEWGAKARKLSGGRGVDRVVEVGGPATLPQSLKAIARGGEIVLIGFLAKAESGVDYFALFGSGAIVRPVMVGDRTVLRSAIKVIAASGLKPVVDKIYDFEDARAAFAHLESGAHVGKVGIRIA